MKAQIFLCWVKMLSFIHSPFSEPTVLGSDKTVFEQNNRAPLAPGAPQMCGGHFYWERESEGLKGPPTWPLLLRDWKASLYIVCIQVYCIQVYFLYWSPTVFVFMVPGGLVELLLLLWALLSGVLLQASYCFPLYYSLLLVLCVVQVLSGPQKFNYYNYFLKLSLNYFQDFVLRKENSVCTSFSY